MHVSVLAKASPSASSSAWESASEAHVRELEAALVEARKAKKEASARALWVEQDRDAAREGLVVEKKAQEEAEGQATTASSQLLQGASAMWTTIEDMGAALPLLGIDVDPLTHP